MTAARATHAYAARCKCGNVIALMVDDERYARDNAKEIGKLMRAGYTIERVTIEEARAAWISGCTCPKEKKAKKAGKR